MHIGYVRKIFLRFEGHTKITPFLIVLCRLTGRLESSELNSPARLLSAEGLRIFNPITQPSQAVWNWHREVPEL
jgi:hypothetical protein